MNPKFSWLLFFITLFTASGFFLMFMPFPREEEINTYGYLNFSKGDYIIDDFFYPSRSFDQIIYINISLLEGKITIQLLDLDQERNYWLGLPYITYWEAVNITEITEKIQISPPFLRGVFLIYYGEEYSIMNGDVKTRYFRYYTSYSVFLIGVAVILFLYWSYQKYKEK